MSDLKADIRKMVMVGIATTKPIWETHPKDVCVPGGELVNLPTTDITEFVDHVEAFIRSRFAEVWGEGYARGQDSILGSQNEWPLPTVNPYVVEPND